MSLEMATFKFIACIGKTGNYPCNGQTYETVIVGGKAGLINALKELKPIRIERLS